MVREAHGAEIHSRRLGERIRDGFEARYRRHADPAGSAPLGFRRQRIHVGACFAWGGRRTYPTDTWYRPMLAQVSAIQLDNATIERVVRVLAAPSLPNDELRRNRLQVQRRLLALDYAAGKIREPEFLSAAAMIRDQEAETPRAARPLNAASVVRRLRDFAGLWASRSEAERAEMLRNVYTRVEVEGSAFIRAHLTPDARELGLSSLCLSRLLWCPRQVTGPR